MFLTQRNVYGASQSELWIEIAEVNHWPRPVCTFTPQCRDPNGVRALCHLCHVQLSTHILKIPL